MSTTSSRLGQLVGAARCTDAGWDADRASRVLVSALELRARRTTRARLLRQSMVIAATAGIVLMVLLRALAPAVGRAADAREASPHDPTSPLDMQASLAVHGELAARDADGGYGRD